MANKFNRGWASKRSTAGFASCPASWPASHRNERSWEDEDCGPAKRNSHRGQDRWSPILDADKFRGRRYEVEQPKRDNLLPNSLSLKKVTIEFINRSFHLLNDRGNSP